MAHDAGMIVLWSGSIATIPPGWALCDGTNGTPDLTDRFVPGAGASYNPGDQGGSSTHSHPFTGDGHSHDLQAGTHIQAGSGRDDTTGITPVFGTTDVANHIPPFYALAYIMRL